MWDSSSRGTPSQSNAVRKQRDPAAKENTSCSAKTMKTQPAQHSRAGVQLLLPPIKAEASRNKGSQFTTTPTGTGEGVGEPDLAWSLPYSLDARAAQHMNTLACLRFKAI